MTCHKSVALNEAYVERGMRDGQEINFARSGDSHPDVDIPGAINWRLQAVPHPVWSRPQNKDDLQTTLTLSLGEALAGFRRTVDVFGHEATFDKKFSQFRPGQRVRLEGEGMPVHNFPSQRGDLYAELQVELPETLTAEQRRVIEQVL